MCGAVSKHIRDSSRWPYCTHCTSLGVHIWQSIETEQEKQSDVLKSTTVVSSSDLPAIQSIPSARRLRLHREVLPGCEVGSVRYFVTSGVRTPSFPPIRKPTVLYSLMLFPACQRTPARKFKGSVGGRETPICCLQVSITASLASQF